MHIPKGAVDIHESNNGLFRIGLQGAPKTGKSWAALTFPNPIVLDFDNNLRGFEEVYPEKKILKLKFHDPRWVKENIGAQYVSDQTGYNVRDAVRRWFKDNGHLLTPEQTLIFDSWTSYQAKFDAWYVLNPLTSKDGEVNGFAFWRHKKDFSEELCDRFKEVNCNVVVVFHEQPERNSKGELTGMLKPAMDGQFADRLAAYFTDWYRQVVIEEEVDRKDDSGKLVKVKMPFFYWQVASDGLANCGTSIRKLDIKTTDKRGRKLIPAKYESLIS